MNLEITRNSADYEYGDTTFVVETASAHRGHKVITYTIPDLEKLKQCLDSVDGAVGGIRDAVRVVDCFWSISKRRPKAAIRPMFFQFGVNCAKGIFEDFENETTMVFLRTRQRSLRTCMKLFPWIHKQDRPFWYVELRESFDGAGYVHKVICVEPEATENVSFVEDTMLIFNELGGDWNVMQDDGKD